MNEINSYDKRIQNSGDLNDKIYNDSISNIDSLQNEQSSDNKGIDIIRSIVKKNAYHSLYQNQKQNIEINLLNNDNLNNILYNKNKKKVDAKIERLDFLSSSFQNSFQSNSNNIDINKIPIHNNKIFNNVFNVKPINNNGIQNKFINANNNINKNTNNVKGESTGIKREFENEELSENFNRKNLNLCLISSNNELINTNLERELLKKNLGVYEMKNYDNDLQDNKGDSLNIKKESLLQSNINNLKNELNCNENIQRNSSESSLDKLKKNLNKLDEEKTGLEKGIIDMRKKIKNIKREDYIKKINFLEKERDDCKKTANNYLHLCSQLAEEVIVLRNQLDKYTHFKKDK